MNYRSLARNAGTAFLAQGVAFFLSVLQTLLVPKLLGTEQYGYWQLFIFYCSYVGFAPLGLNDGVYLINGGVVRGEINKKSIISQLYIGVAIECFFALCLVTIAIFGGFGADREFVIVCTSLFLIIQCVAMYFAYVLQAMNETRRSSYSTIVERLTFLIPLLVLLIFQCHSYRPFIISYIFSSVAQLAYCCWYCRDFFAAGLEPLSQALFEAARSACVGFKLMVANIASQLILGIARFAIDAVWGINAFGELSFALSMVNFFLAFVAQASMVLFPALRQGNKTEIQRFYQNARDVMTVFSPVLYLLYFPIVALLSLWLPGYSNSFIFFILLIPLCIFDSKMNICCTTFFKVLREESLLLRINMTTCIASLVFTFIGVFLFQSIYAVIGGVVLAIVCRSILSELYLSKTLDCPAMFKLTVGELLLSAVFIFLSFLMPSLLAFFVYFLAYGLFLFIFRNVASNVVAKLLNLFRVK